MNFEKIPTTNITYTTLQNYTNVMVDEHGIQTLKVMVVVFVVILLLFEFFVLPLCSLLSVK